MPIFTLPDASAYLVAFSGGADSRLLLELSLRALLERDGEEGRRKLTAAHLHHGIRGEEADRDLAFCGQVCRELGIRLISERADVPAAAAATGESIETAARRLRYEFFSRILAEDASRDTPRKDIPLLLTAHHADDNLETVLERLLRGSGTRGMGGIPPTRFLAGDRGSPAALICRPLLEWTRREILSACADMDLDYVTDSTNLEDDCTRNRIRHTVIPALEAIAGPDAPQKAALRMSRIAREDEDLLNAMAERRVYASPRAEAFPTEELRELHPAVAKRVLSILYRDALAVHGDGAEGEALASVHLEALLELARKGIPEAPLALPRGMEAVIRGEWLYVRPAAPPPPPSPPAPVPVGIGRTPFGEGISVEAEYSPTPLPPREGPGVFASAVFPPDLPLPLIARPREAGDTILSHGMTKKLKKILCDKSIPVHLRHRLPLLCLPDGPPLWYPGGAFRDGYPAPKEGPCLRITVLADPAIIL